MAEPQSPHTCPTHGSACAINPAQWEMSAKLGVSAPLLHEAYMAAQEKVERAKKHEPQVTNDLKFMAKQNGGKMEGLDFRVKGFGSLFRKITFGCGKRIVHGESPALQDVLDDPSMDMNDVLRYTMVFPSDQYTQSVSNVIEALLDAGYSEGAMNNFWPAKGELTTYVGINSFFRTKCTRAGSYYEFELQFHTPESLEVKQNSAHLYYEEFRTELDEKKRARLYSQMILCFRECPVPDGVHRLGQVAHIPAPDGLLAMDAQGMSEWESFRNSVKTPLLALMEKAKVQEPATTQYISYLCVVHSGTDVLGDGTLAGQQRLLRNVWSLVHSLDVTPEAAVTDCLWTSLNYYITFPTEHYCTGVRGFVHDLHLQHFNVKLALNYWKDAEPYYGIRLLVQTPESAQGGSVRFQILFHTPESWEASQRRYNTLRSRFAADSRNQAGVSAALRINEKLKRMWASVPRPQGVEEIGVLRYQGVPGFANPDMPDVEVLARHNPVLAQVCNIDSEDHRRWYFLAGVAVGAIAYASLSSEKFHCWCTG